MRLGRYYCITQSVLLIFVLDNIDEAYALIKDLEPSSPQEYILKAVANTIIGQEHGAVSHTFNDETIMRPLFIPWFIRSFSSMRI